MEENFNHQSKGHYLVAIIAILMLGAIVIVAILRDRIVNNQFRQITVMGEGKVSYQPDTATVNLGVQIDKVAKADDALNQLNAKMAKVIAAVKALGIADEDIVTENYSLVPQYDYGPITPMSYSSEAVGAVATPAIGGGGGSASVLKIINYSANQQLDVKVKDLKNNQNLLNKVIGEATKAGVNQILGITFEASNLEDLKQQARVKAIGDAKGKAVALATAAGVQLKDITGWYENFVKGGGYGEASALGVGGAGGGAPMPQVTVGGNEVVVDIGVTYNIK
jgi:uncharacterized protein YggE